MGYRSDVEIVVMAADKETLNKVVAIWQMTDEYQKSGCIDMLETSRISGEFGYDRQPFIRYSMRGVKWYCDYLDVTAFAKLLDIAGDLGEEGGLTVGTGYVRIGENTDDVEREFGGHEDVTDELADEMYTVTDIVVGGFST